MLTSLENHGARAAPRQSAVMQSANVDVSGYFKAQAQITEVRIDPLHGVSPRLVLIQDVAPRS